MRRNTCATTLLCLLGLACVANAYNRGDGTAYSGYKEKNKTGFNSCGFGKLDDRWERYYAALPSSTFNRGSDCGRCLRARGTERGASGDWVTVKVVDECAGCKRGDVDFSTDALKAITGYSWDRKGIEWEFTDCDGGDNKSNRQADSQDKKDEEPNKWEDDDWECVRKKKSKGDRRLLGA